MRILSLIGHIVGAWGIVALLLAGIVNAIKAPEIIADLRLKWSVRKSTWKWMGRVDA